MDINLNNLRKTEDVGDEFKITCNYNLLDNNQFVRWNGDDITLIKPYGLSKVNRIDFRNFKGELLPYTSLNLPELNFEVLMTSRDIDSATITSTEETIYGDTLKYNEDTDTRSVYKFKKAWTYDEKEDSQLMYNIREGIDIINNHFNTLYPIRNTIQVYGISNDDVNVVTYNYRPIDCNAGSMLFVAGPDNLGDVHMIIPLNNNFQNVYTYNTELNDFLKYCSQCSVNFSNTLGYMWRESERGRGGTYGAITFFVNSGTIDNPNWEFNYDPNIYEDWTTTNNKFGVDEAEPSFSLGHCPAGWCVVVSPLIGRSGRRALAAIKTINNAYWLDFQNVAHNNIVYVSAVYEDPENNANLYILAHYTVEGYPINIITGIFKVPFSSMSVDSENPVNMAAYRVYNSIPVESPLFVSWGTMDRLCSCGKECYGIQISKDGNGVINGIIFVGVRGCEINGDVISSTNRLYGWAVDDHHMFVSEGNRAMKKVSMLTGDVMDRIRNGYINDVAQETLPHHGPVYVCKATGGWIQNPEVKKLRFLADINNSFNPKELKNAIHAANAIGVDLNATATQGADTFALANTNGDLATTNSEDWFSLVDSSIMIPQLVFPDNRVINFAVRIWTEPYYFEIFTPCQYFSSEVFSIVKPVLTPSYNWLNTHIINTLETLILLHYEYNNLKISCQMFPNMDGVVFFINEDAFIGFKSMNVSNTIDGLKVSIIGDDEKVSLETLRRLYGKLSLSVDWVQ